MHLKSVILLTNVTQTNFFLNPKLLQTSREAVKIVSSPITTRSEVQTLTFTFFIPLPSPHFPSCSLSLALILLPLSSPPLLLPLPTSPLPLPSPPVLNSSHNAPLLPNTSVMHSPNIGYFLI